MYLTELELIDSYSSGLLLLEQQLNKKKISIEEIVEFALGYVSFNFRRNFKVIYVNKNVEDYFGISNDEIIDLGDQFCQLYMHPSVLNNTIPKIINFGKNHQKGNAFVYFQKVRKSENEKFDNFIGITKVMKSHNCFITIAHPIACFNDMTNKINHLIDENDFLRNNYKKFTSLTKREIEIIRLIGKGQSRNCISESLNISIHTFDNHRKNIRQKLELKSASDLFQYITAFDLI